MTAQDRVKVIFNLKLDYIFIERDIYQECIHYYTIMISFA